MNLINVSVQCRNVGFVYFTFCIEIILWCIVLLSLIIVTYQLWGNNDTQIHKIFKYLCVFGESICLLAISGLGILIVYKFDCNPNSTSLTGLSIGDIAGTIGFLSYSFTLTSLYSIFGFRVFWSFVGSVYHLSKSTIKRLIIVFIIQFTFNISAILSYLFNELVGLALTSITFVK